MANSIAELWTMQSYLQPDVLAEADLAAFDSWAATFARTVTALELAPDGGSYRMKTRFARFQNVPELITLYRQVADVRTAEDLALPVPALAGGRPETAVVPPSPALRTYVADLASRAEQVRSRSVLPDEDNMLKITGDGRRAALDLRLVGERPDPTGGKLAAAADRIADIHRSTAGLRFVDEGGQPHPRPGALQLVFCGRLDAVGDGLERLRRTAWPARWPGRANGRRALRARGRHRRSQGPAVRGMQGRTGGGTGRLHRQDGRRHERPGPRRRPAPSRLPVAPG
ncbi:MAG: hypothetical protein M3P85_04250 [Actinomycetota bacterium]|nr:hypothetical protein [Actinomycetota bacterium]